MEKKTMALLALAVVLIVGAVFVSAELIKGNSETVKDTSLTTQSGCGCGCNGQCGGNCGIEGCNCGR